MGQQACGSSAKKTTSTRSAEGSPSSTGSTERLEPGNILEVILSSLDGPGAVKGDPSDQTGHGLRRNYVGCLGPTFDAFRWRSRPRLPDTVPDVLLGPTGSLELCLSIRQVHGLTPFTRLRTCS